MNRNIYIIGFWEVGESLTEEMPAQEIRATMSITIFEIETN